MQPPKVDGRDSRDLVSQLRLLLPRYTPAWSQDAHERQLAEAMMHVFARFGEILIDRINRAPEKNFLAFLQLLGVANLPPRAAQTPLTFYLAGEGADFAVVPERSQVAAQLLKGEKNPILFETDRELVVVSSRLTSLFVKEGARDRFSDLSQMLPQVSPASAETLPPPTASLIFSGDTPIPHRLYLELSVFSASSKIDKLTLRIELQERAVGAVSQPAVAWELVIPAPPKIPPRKDDSSPDSLLLEHSLASGKSFKPVSDTTEGLTKTGEIVFENVPRSSVPSPQNQQKIWIVGDLKTPIVSAGPATVTSESTPQMPPEDLPILKGLSATMRIDRIDLQITHAFFNLARLDLTKDFYPFGERPKFGDTLYLGSSELFSHPYASVTLQIDMTNPAGAQSPSPVLPVSPQKVRLAWEFWDGMAWSPLGASEDDAPMRILDPHGAPAQPRSFRDGTNAFSISGEVSLKFSSPPAPIVINGVSDYWIRVRLASGNYGQETHREKERIGSTPVPANFDPPVIRSVRADYQIRADLAPPSLTTYNDFSYRTLRTSSEDSPNPEPIRPFFPVSSDDERLAIYLGFELPPAKLRSGALPGSLKPASFPPRSMCIYLDVEQSSRGGPPKAASPDAKAIHWEYWNGLHWVKWTVRDETGGFRHPGLIRFLAPSDFAASSRFGRTRYWLRAIPPDLSYEPKIRMALLNTVMATGSITVSGEQVGVSTGLPEQSFRLLHTPVLSGQRLDVLEPRMPGRMEQEAIQSSEGEDAIQLSSRVASQPGVWVRWHPVRDFFASGPRDRHYSLDALSGLILFGDGANGQIPPRKAKIRASYRSGGGSAGNRPAWNITQLKTAIPYIGKVCNWIPATAGGDAEADSALLERGSRGLRHGGRAVAVQDYEDLARLASPQVARSKGVPLFDLVAEPVGRHRCPGVVSVIIVPHSDDPRPSPGSQLLGCVQQYLRCSASPAAQIRVVAPQYIRVDITADIAVNEWDNIAQIELATKLALTSFLHPLTGGPRASGWSFGRMPHRSDLYLLLGSVHGVKYVRDVRIFAIADYPGLEHTDYFLVSPGQVEVVPSVDPSPTTSQAGAACQ